MDINEMKFDEKGLIPAIVQDARSKEVLMMAYMNKTSLEKTIETKRTWFYSRSRKELWNKGETSGNYQEVKEIKYDCDNDTLLILVDPLGPACHTGEMSCFYRTLLPEKSSTPSVNYRMLFDLYDLVLNRKSNPIEGSYTNYLFREGVDKICKKIGEEAAETIIAAKNNSREELIYEASDLLYHLTVLLAEQQVTYEDLMGELANRHKK